jgi:hypothetical protein
MKHHKSTFARFIFSLAICLTTIIPMNAYSAGTYPVQVNTMLIPPYSLSLNDYSSGFTEKIAITLLNRDLMQPQLKVKLRLTIKCASDLTLRTKPDAWFDLIVLDAGIPTRLTLEEVLPYFLLKNLDVQGYMKGDALPEGLIEFQVEVFEYSSGVSISMNTVSVAHLSLPKPPKLIQPENRKIIPQVDPTNLLFQWAPQYFGNTGAINYEFILKELPANILSVEDAFLSAPIVYQSTHESTSFLYSASEPALQVGKKYAWAVRSILNQDTDPNIRLDNNGYSTINSFDVSELNLPPTGINATVTPEGEIDLKWTPRMNHTKFVVTFSRDDQEPKVWHDIQATEPNTKISNIAPGYAYVFRIGAYCASIAEPTYSNYSTVKVSQSEETVNPDCGKKPTIKITNRNPIEKLDVDDKIMVGDFPVRLTQVTGGGGTFSGTGITFIPYLNSNLSVTFSNIGVNTDKCLISGMVSVDIDKNESGIVNLDALDQGGTGGKVVAGVAKVDRVLDFTMPEKLTMQYTPETGTMEFFDGSTSVGSVDIPKNKAAESDFPFTVEDKDGNVYEIQENPEKSSNNDAAPYVAVKLGNQEGPILDGSMSFTSLAQNEGVVTFDNDDTSQYAIDQTQDYYQSVMIIKDKYQLLDGKYQVKWKYIPPGKTEQIIAKLDNKNNIDPTKVKFKTRVGKVYESAYNSEKNTYTITLVGGQDADGQELFAIYPATTPGIWSNLGKLNIISYTPTERSLVLVKTLENDDTEAGEVEDELNQIYNPVGVNWTVSSEQFTYNADGLFEGGSGILSTYLPNMRTLNAAFKADKVAKGLSIDSKAAYLFLVKQAAGGDRDKQGFMPRGMQFGYIEASPTGGGLVGVVAHELGHGVFRLYHTFNANYGDIAVDLKGSTDNLMDYKGGTDLAKWQWDMIYDPAILNGVFDGDKEAASFGNVPVEQKDGIMYKLDNEMNFVTLSGKIIRLPKDAIVKFYCVDPTSYQTQGMLVGFITNGKSYCATKAEINSPVSDFTGYYELVSGKYTTNTYYNGYESLIAGKQSVSYIHQDKLDNGLTRIKIITEQADVDKSQIELKNGNFNGKRLPSPSYNSNAEVQTTEQIEFKSACDFGTSNTNIINYAGNLANDHLALFNNSASSVATNSNIKTTLYLTSTPTTDQLNTINAKLASPGSNELVIWANFDTTTKKWTIKGLSSGSGDLKNKDGRNVNPFVKALDKILPDLSGFSASFNPITAILDGLSDLIGNASVAEKYYNPAATDYNPIPVKVYELISSPTLTNKINDVLKNNNGFNSPTEKYSDAAVQFAFTCGVWNGLVGTVQAVPAGTSMLVKAPGGILDLIMNTDGSRDKLTNFASNFDWDTAEILAKQLGGVLGAGWTKYTSNPCMISYSSGQAGFVIISCAIGAGEAKAASTFFETIEKLDVAGQLMSKALKYGGKGVGLILKVPTKSVKFALSEGFALAKRIEIRPLDKLFCDFAFPKIKLNQLTEDVASLSTKVEEAINVAGGLQSLPLDENGNRLAKILVGGEETPVIIGTNDKLNEVDWEQLPGYSGSGVEEALPIFIKELSADLNSFVTQFKSVGSVEFLSDGKSLVLKSSTGEELGKIIDGKLNITSEQILKIPKGSRPNPVLYKSASEIAEYFDKFKDGVVRFTTDEYPTLGNTEAFVMAKSEFGELMIETGGNLSLIEKKLALNEGTLTGKNAVIAWIKNEDLKNLRMPSGNEAGAIPGKWIPGGKTFGGISEAVLDLSNPSIPKVLFPF